MNRNLVNKQLNPATIRVLGGVLIFIGILLVGGMGAIMMWINNAINNPASPAKFNGTPEEQQVTFLILGTVAAFGLSAVFADSWQILTGRRSKMLIWAMLGLWVVLMSFSWIVKTNF